MIAIVPSRLGSVGIPQKNIMPLAGIAPVVRACLIAKSENIRLIITSDAIEAEQRAWGCNADVYLYAPSPLHTNNSSMVDVVADVLARVPGPPDEIILLLQPTQPLREVKHLHAVIALLEYGHPSVATAVETEPVQKLWHEGFEPARPGYMNLTERRQDCIPTFCCDGTCYGFRRSWFLKKRQFVVEDKTRMLVIPPEESAPLDTPFDWQMAELRLKARAEMQAKLVTELRPAITLVTTAQGVASGASGRTSRHEV